MPKLKHLRQRHPSIDKEENERLLALYEGGNRFSRNLQKFLPARPQEQGERYAARRKEAVYRNYVGPIVDYFTSLLFSSRPRAVAKDKNGDDLEETPEYYSQFRDDCDTHGADLDDTFKGLLTDALVQGKSWLWLQHPGGQDVRNRAEFEELKLGDSWVTPLTFDDVLDWETDDGGVLAWAIVHSKSSKRESLSGGRSKVTETWHHLQRDRVDTYQISYEDNKPPNEDMTDVPLVASVGHRYGAVPLVCLDLPVGLWVTSRLETPQLAHFRMSNAQAWGMSATCYAMPVFKVKSPENFKKAAMGAGYGFFIHPDEDIEWTAPAAAPFAALSEEIKSHKDEIFRIAHTMALGVENNAAAVGRSAESKATDARATGVVMLSYSRIVKETMELVYDMISRARGDEITWSIEGMDDFAADDLFGLVDVAEQMENFGGIPSKTFQVEFKTRLAESIMPDLDQAKKNEIKREIETGVGEQTVDAREEREARKLSAISSNLRKEPVSEPQTNVKQ